MAVDVDTLQIQIEAESSDAAAKVNELAEALERLHGVVKGEKTSSAASEIKTVGDAAKESAAAAKIQQKQQALQDAAATISPKVDPSSAAEIESLTKKVELLRSAIEDINETKISAGSSRNTFWNADQELRALDAKYEEFEKILDSLGQYQEKDFPDLFSNIYGAMDTIRERTSYLMDHRGTIMSTSLEAIKAQNDEAARIVAEINDGAGTSIEKQMQAAADASANTGQQVASAGQQIESTTEKVGILSRALQAVRSVSAGAFSTLRSAASAAGSALASAGQVLKRFGSAAASVAGSAVKKLGSGLKSIGSLVVSRFTKPFTNATSVLKRWKSMMSRLLFYRVFRSAISAISNAFKTGTNNLYQYSRLIGTEFAPAMDSLATSAQYLKDSFAAMAAPLIQAVAPAIDLLVDKFVDLLNIIGKVFAALSGKSTYTQAVKVAKEYAEATNEAANAAKNFLLGIDELNILDNSSSGSGSTEDYGSMFEEVEVPSGTMDWAAQIRQAIEEGDWRSAGSLLAEKLNEIVGGWDAAGWGERLGRKINNGLNAAYGFLTTFDFEGLGGKVATGLNGILDKVDWDLLGRTIAAKWNALIDFLYGFITTFEWGKFGKAIADAFIGFFSEIDWQRIIELVQAGVEAVREFLVGFFSEFGEGAQPLVDIVNTICNTIQRVIDATKKWAEELDLTPLKEAFGTLLEAIAPLIDTICGGLLWAYENVLLPLAGWAIEEGAPVVVRLLAEAFELLNNVLIKLQPVAQWIFENILQPLASFAWDAISFGLEKLTSVISKLNDLLSGNTSFGDFLESLSGGESVVMALASGFVMMINPILGAATALTALTAGFNNLSKWAGGILDGIVEGISNGLDAFREWFLGILQGIVDWFKDFFGIHSPSTVFAELGVFLIQGLLNGISGAWSVITDFFGEKVNAIKESLSAAWDNIKETASGKWEGIKTVLGGAWDSIKQKASDTWDSMKTTVSMKFEEIKTSISNTWENVKTTAASKWDDIKATLSGAWDGVKTTAGTKFNEIKTEITGIWDGIKNSAKTWGSDICSNLANGIKNGISTVTSAVTSVADKIKSLLGFSEPDIGPLSDFHTYMPDMLELMAKGIKDNAHLAVNAVYGLADSVAGAFGDIAAEELQFPVHEDAHVRYGVEFAESRSGTTGSGDNDSEGLAAGIRSANEEMISVIYAVAQQIVTAVSNSGGDVYLDGTKVGSRTTSVQNRQNRMYGKTLQNA